MQRILKEANTVCKNICMNILHYLDILIFFQDVSVTLIGKTDPSYPNKCEDYWIDTLKTKATHGTEFDFKDSF